LTLAHAAIALSLLYRARRHVSTVRSAKKPNNNHVSC